MRRFTAAPFSSTVYSGDDVMIDTTHFDPVTGRSSTERVVHRRGVVRRSQFLVRLPTIPELDAWLADVGFTEREFFGRDDSPPTVEDMQMLAIAIR